MQNSMIPWEKIYHAALSCCQFYDVKSFSIGLLQELNKLIVFDEAVVFYLDGNQNVIDYYLFNVNPKWMHLYIGYYSQINKKSYGISDRNLDLLDDVYVHEWGFEQPDEFIKDFIRPRNLAFSLGFPLRDRSGRVRTVISLDRLSGRKYSEYDILLVQKIRDLVNTYHRLLFDHTVESTQAQAMQFLAAFTNREKEVFNLLVQGLSPSNIAHVLHITVPTTNKHIYNIYKKCNVSSRMELMTKTKNLL